MSWIFSTSTRHAGWGLVFLRLIVGFTFMYAGLFKLIEFGPAGFGQSLAAAGVPFAIFFAYVVLILEIVGGAGIILGLLTRPFALLLTVDMVMAIILVTSKIGFMDPTGKSGAEMNLLLIGGLLALLFGGAGSISLDRVIGGGEAEAR
jgi:putative oxidoreductase